MSSDQERLLQLRQLELRLRCATLRVQLAHDVAGLQRPLALADRAYRGYHWLRAHPLWLLGGSGGAVMLLSGLKTGRLLRWVRRGLWAWRLFATLGAKRQR